nr:MAG TPA: hypothetical protein [Caudoviricetes sp.]
MPLECLKSLRSISSYYILIRHYNRQSYIDMSVLTMVIASITARY